VAFCKLAVERDSATGNGAGIQTLSELVGRVTQQPRLAVAVELFVSLLQICFAIGYIIVILRMAHQVLPDVPKWAVVAAVLVLVVLMAFIRHLRDLWWVSFLGISISVVGIIGVTTVTGIVDFHSSDARIQFWGDGFLSSTCDAGTLVSHIGSFLYSVEAINHVMPNANAMTTPAHLPSIIFLALATYGVLVGGFMLFAAQAGFGDCPAGGSILLDCLPGGAVSTGVKSAVVVQMLLSFPVTMFPAVEMMEGRLFPSGEVREEHCAQHEGLQTSLLSEEETQVTKGRNSPNNGGAASGIEEDSSEDGQPCLAQYCVPRQIFRVVVFIVAVACALVVPNFETFTGLIGSLLLSLLGFLLPVFLHEKVRLDSGSPVNPLMLGFHIAIVVLGAVLATFGTYNSVKTAVTG